MEETKQEQENPEQQVTDVDIAWMPSRHGELPSLPVPDEFARVESSEIKSAF